MGQAVEREGRAALVPPVSVVDAVYDVIYDRLMALDTAPGARMAIDALARDLESRRPRSVRRSAGWSRRGWCERPISSDIPPPRS